MTDSTFTFRVDEDLKAAFAAAAEADERTAAQLLRHLMRGHVDRHRAEDAHDAWFRRHVEAAVVEADDVATERVAHDAVATSWQRQRDQFERRGAGRSA